MDDRSMPTHAPDPVTVGFDLGRLPTAFFENPYPTYARLRRETPILQLPDGSWLLTRHADLDAVYRDRQSFSSDKKAAFGPKFGTDTPLFAHHTTSLVFSDPPYHTRVRRRIVSALSPAAIRSLVPGLDALVRRLCATAQARGHFDLVEDFAAAIPIEVIGNLLGVPHDEREPLRAWSMAILGALDPAPAPAMIANGQRSVTAFLAYLARLVDDRRRHPLGDSDIISRLLREDAASAPLTEQELLHNCIFLLNAGHETTTNLIATGLVNLLPRRDDCARLVAQPALVPLAVEECLRYESPNQLGNRLVIAPVTIGGHTFVPGDYLTLAIGAANRDPEVFAEPDAFRIDRAPNPHLAFAAGGHACAGMSVARTEADLAIRLFLSRLPSARLEGTPLYQQRARFRGLVRADIVLA
ncbi:MAG: cytochrome P450 [Pseudomonadota bacterium]|jgi:cytochrome P450